MTLTAPEAIDQLIADQSVAHAIIHGPATGPTSSVNTDSGAVPTFAKAAATALAGGASGFNAAGPAGTQISASGLVLPGSLSLGTATADKLLNLGWAGDTYMKVTNSGTSTSAYFGVTGANAVVQCAGAATTFSPTGKVSVGTLAVGGWSGLGRLAVESNAAEYPLSLYNAYTSGAGALFIRSDNAASHFVDFNYGTSTNVGSITTNGSATSYNTTSDGFLKFRRKPLDPGDLFDKVEVWEGRWIKAPDTPWVGVIQQDLEKLLPGSTTPGDTELLPHQDGYRPGMLDLPQVMVPRLMAEAKSLRARVKSLETTIADLQARLAAAGI
jgi:hypothetical protein